jgi:hypothetical protein
MNMCLKTSLSGRDVTQEMVVVIRCLKGTLAHGPAQIDYGVAALRSIPKTDLLYSSVRTLRFFAASQKYIVVSPAWPWALR